MIPEFTLEKLAKRGVIRVGYQSHTPPFSYSIGPDFDPLGYSVFLAEKVCQYLSQSMATKVTIEPVEITSSTREQVLLDGAIDIECGSTTVTESRRKKVAFSQPIFETSHRVAIKNSTRLDSQCKLKVTGIVGSTSFEALNSAPSLGFSFDFFGQDSIRKALISFFEDPFIDGIVADEIILVSYKEHVKSLGGFILEQRLGSDFYGFMLRKTDSDLLGAVNIALANIMTSPSFLEEISPWFTEPLEKIGVSIDLTRSEVLTAFQGCLNAGFLFNHTLNNSELDNL
jgi:glutamate/aspartate transport system substrate-binding protein